MLLLCSTDASIAGEAAMRVGAELADRLHDELAALDHDARDPSPRLLAAAGAAGCDLLVLGYAPRSRLATHLPSGWHWRIVPDAPCPVMLVPVGCQLPRDGGVVLGDHVPILPHHAARSAGRLAERLRVPLIVTHVLSGGVPAARPTGWQVRHDARVLTPEPDRGAGGSVCVRHVEREGRLAEQLPRAAVADEAAMIVIAGRGPGRTLLPRRRVAPHLSHGARLPIVVAAARPEE